MSKSLSGTGLHCMVLSCARAARDPNKGKIPKACRAFGFAKSNKSGSEFKEDYILTRDAVDAGPKPLSHGLYWATPSKARAGPTS